MIDEMLAYNEQFVANEEYKKFTTSKYPVGGAAAGCTGH